MIQWSKRSFTLEEERIFLVMKAYQVKVNLIIRDRKKSKTVISKIIKRDLYFNNLNINMIQDEVL